MSHSNYGLSSLPFKPWPLSTTVPKLYKNSRSDKLQKNTVQQCIQKDPQMIYWNIPNTDSSLF